MLDLNVIREQIDGIDKQLVDLFEQRMKLTKEVAEYKIQTGKKVHGHLMKERKFLIHRENVRRLKLLQSLLKMRLMSMPLMTYFHRLWLIQEKDSISFLKLWVRL